MILGVLGGLPFVAGKGSLFSPHSISKIYKNSWARHKILNGIDVLEDTGYEPIDLSIEMSFFAPWTFDPSSSLTMLETFAAAKVPLPVILGGTPLGRGGLTLFVVESVDAKMTKWAGSSLTVMSVTVKLCEFAIPSSPLMSFLSNPLGSIAGAVGGAVGNVVGGAVSSVTGAVSGTVNNVISSIGLPGPIGGAVSSLGLSSNPNILAAGPASAAQTAAAQAAGRAATGG
jgi:Phage P2 GpU